MFAALDEDVPPPLACADRFFLRKTISSCGGASSIPRASGERDLRRRMDPGPVGTRALFSRCRMEPVGRRFEELEFWVAVGGIVIVINVRVRLLYRIAGDTSSRQMISSSVLTLEGWKRTRYVL